MNPPGPVQAYVTPGVSEFPTNSISAAVQGEPPVAGIAIGKAVIVTIVVSESEIQPSIVTTKLYAPSRIISDGFCSVELYPLGPDHS